MTSHVKAILTASLLSAVCLLNSANAQTGPTTGPSTGWPTDQPTTGLSESDLEAALRARDSGLRVRKLFEKETGAYLGTMYSLSVRIGNDKHRVVVFTDRLNKIALLVPLTRPLAPWKQAQIEPQRVEFNRRLAPCALKWDLQPDGARTLVAELVITRPATAQVLFQQLDQLVGNVELARPVWGGLR